MRTIPLRILLPVALLLLLTANASAAGWVAAMEEDEGGPAMTASVTGEGPGEFAPVLSMMCSDEVGLRYLPAGDFGGPNETANFSFASESDEVVLAMQYEAMDGAFAAYFPPTDKLIALLQGGTDLLVTNPGGKVPPQTFTLAGSRAAIDKMLATCR